MTERERRAAYYRENLERIRARVKTYREEHAAEITARRRAARPAQAGKIRAQKAAYYAANREAILARARQLRRAGGDAVNARRREEYRANKQVILARNRKWREANRSAYLAGQEKYRRELADSVRAVKQAWYNRHREHVAARARAGYLSDRNSRLKAQRRRMALLKENDYEKWRALKAHEKARRRAALAAVPSTLTLPARARVTSEPCFYCGTRDRRRELDHFVPVARGGHDCLHNAASACRDCNGSKSARMPSDSERARFAITYAWARAACPGAQEMVA